MTSLLASIFGSDKEAATNNNNNNNELFGKPVVASTTTRIQPKHATTKSVVNNNNNNNDMDTDEAEPSGDQQQQEETAMPQAKEELPSNDNKDNNDDDDDVRTIFVGNLPVGTTRKELARLFRKCGSVQSTRIRSVATVTQDGVKLPPHLAGKQGLVQQVLVNQNKVDASAKTSVQGYVVFALQESVEKALELNNTPVPGKATTDQAAAATTTTTTTNTTRRMRVDRVQKDYDARRSVFVGNLPYQADEEGLRACFVQHCENWSDTDIHGVRIVRDKQTHQCKGFGYLLFQDTTMVATALRTMDGVPYLGRPLRVRVCGKRFKTRTADNRVGSSSKERNKASDKPVAAALKQIVTLERQQQEQKQNKRKRGVKKAHATGKSKRAVAEAKTNQRIKKIEKRLQKGMGKMRQK